MGVIPEETLFYLKKDPNKTNNSIRADVASKDTWLHNIPALHCYE